MQARSTFLRLCVCVCVCDCVCVCVYWSDSVEQSWLSKEIEAGGEGEGGIWGDGGGGGGGLPIKIW
jgi:hypothetical protein